MENNNVKVQATPSHCTGQENKEVKEVQKATLAGGLTLGENEVEPVVVKTLSRKAPKTFDKELHEDLQKDVGKEVVDRMVDDKLGEQTLVLDTLTKVYPKDKEDLVVPAKSRDFDCFIKESRPGVVYMRMAEDEFKVVNLIDKVMEVAKVKFVREARPVSVTRNLHDNIDGIENGEVPKRAIINKQIDCFRKTVLPGYVKVGMPQVKKRAQAFIDVFGLEDDGTLANNITTNYFKYVYGDTFENIEVFSKTLEEPISCLEKFGKYVHGNNEYTYFEFVAMFMYLCECFPTFMEGYTDRDLEYLYDEDLEDFKPADNFDGIYKDLNEMVGLILSNRRLDRLCREKFGEVYPVDVPETSKVGKVKRVELQKKDMIIGYPKDEHRFDNCILRGVTVDESYSKDGLLSLCLSEDDMQKLCKAFEGNKRYLMATQHLVEDIPQEEGVVYGYESCYHWVRMKLRDSNHDRVFYDEICLDFSKANRFRFCKATGALFVIMGDYAYVPDLEDEAVVVENRVEVSERFREVFDETCAELNKSCASTKTVKECVKLTAVLCAKRGMQGQSLSLEERFDRCLRIFKYALGIDCTNVKLENVEVPGAYMSMIFQGINGMHAIVERVISRCVSADYDNENLIRREVVDATEFVDKVHSYDNSVIDEICDMDDTYF